MTVVRFPYGREFLEYDFPDSRFLGVIESALDSYVSPHSPDELIRGAIGDPIGTLPLSELVYGKRKVVLLASDHTRPVPSKLIVSQLFAEIQCGNPNAEININCDRLSSQDNRQRAY
jgi:nickel-dependent lactate racemase